MTLVEILVVLGIIVMVATMIGVAVIPQLQRGRRDATRADAQSVRAAVTLWIAENPGGECPTTKTLVDSGLLDRSRRTVDAWNHEFVIECKGDNISVLSGGPDGKIGTEDDIR